MRLLCPLCQKVISIPDNEAGKAVNCPECKKVFQAPSLFVPEVSAEPVLASPPTRPKSGEKFEFEKTDLGLSRDGLASPNRAASSPAADFGSFRGFSITRQECQWVIRVCLTLAVLLGFFTWVKSAPAGYTAYSQSGWDAFFAGLSVDRVAEEALHNEEALRAKLHTAWWLMPYALALLLAVILSWADLILKEFNLRVPPFVKTLLDQRELVLLLATSLALVFLCLQNVLGWGLESAARTIAWEANATAQAAATTPEKATLAKILMGKELGSYNIQSTLWFEINLFCILLAIVSSGFLYWLKWHTDRRGFKIGVVLDK
jgi:hypothetical protein